MTVPVPDLLPRVEKPSRYLGREINSVHKDPAEVGLRAALVFPDMYEVGMSHLGLHILYGLGNQLNGVQVERVFLPERDMLELLKRENLPLFTLESRTPLRECGLLGITLQSELTYTNVLTILEASGITLNAGDRTDDQPVIVGGGPCAYNPEPLWEFFDLFFLGDGEESWQEMLRILSDPSVKGMRRKDKISALKKVPGIYDPGDFEPVYEKNGTIREVLQTAGPRAVSRGFTDSLDGGLPLSCFMVPFIAPVHDRFNIEAMRGCSRGCRFCHAGMVYRPVRERTADTVLQTACQALSATGFSDLALTGLSIGDYGPLDEVLETLMDRQEKERVSISLPSMRIGGLTPSIARQILRVRRTGFTIAPEAGTDRLRRVINKDFTDEEIVRTARWVFGHGWDAVKLYFMVGLPTETGEDLEATAALVKRIADEAPPRARVTVNISPFVPKPHTPFQWVGQLPEPELRRRLGFLRDGLRVRKVHVKWGRTDQALLEAVLARGDRRMSAVIRKAWEGGASMDGWVEHFSWKTWQEAFRTTGLDPAWYSERDRDESEILPWDHLPCGVEKGFLLKEFRKGLAGETTPDCREAGCTDCGACQPGRPISLPALRKSSLTGDEIDIPEDALPDPDQVVRKVRIVFSKRNDMRFLGHLEMIRTVERACRRACLPIAFSGGFSPKPKITFALSLPTGAEGLGELMDLELAETVSAEEVADRLNRHLPEGLSVLSAWKAPADAGALNGRVLSMEYKALLPDPIEGLAVLADGFLNRESIPVLRTRKGKMKEVDLKNYLVSLRAEDDMTLFFTLALKTGEGSARPGEILRAMLGLGEDSLAQVRLTRTSLTLGLNADRPLSRGGMARVWD